MQNALEKKFNDRHILLNILILKSKYWNYLTNYENTKKILMPLMIDHDGDSMHEQMSGSILAAGLTKLGCTPFGMSEMDNALSSWNSALKLRRAIQ